WMYKVKPYEIWRYDFNNVIIYTVAGFFLHIIANSVRIKEFVLTRKINIQKDTDDLTGLKNKAALTREINEFLADRSQDKGIMLMIDINNFKVVNDTYGHDVGDSVIKQFGAFLNDTFTERDIVGRFGGDEFIAFMKGVVDLESAGEIARKVLDGAEKNIVMPDEGKKITVSIGIAAYHGVEKNYSEIFKRADMALYKAKAERDVGYSICP
ncbi:MAG: GGDEF domain-containing protein, partial [Clostridia bacterium]|nr:GGDEF domain-containing protein [Clostridia bacterium]